MRRLLKHGIFWFATTLCLLISAVLFLVALKRGTESQSATGEEVENFIRLLYPKDTFPERIHRLVHGKIPRLRRHLPALPGYPWGEIREAQKRLEALGLGILPDAAAAMRHPEPYVRFRLLVLVQKMSLSHPEVFPLFQSALLDADPQVRMFALIQLLDFCWHGSGDQELFDDLLGHLDEQSPEVKRLAALVGARRGWTNILSPERISSLGLIASGYSLSTPLTEDAGGRSDWRDPQFWVVLLQNEGKQHPPSSRFSFRFTVDSRNFTAFHGVQFPRPVPSPGGFSRKENTLAMLVLFFWQCHPELRLPGMVPSSIEKERLPWRIQAAYIAHSLGARSETLEAELRSALHSGPHLQEWTLEFLGGLPHTSPGFRKEMMNWILHEPEYQMRAMAVAALGRIGKGDPEEIETLERALADDWVFVRAAAVEVLGRLGRAEEETVRPLLVEALDSPMALVRVSAAGALADWGDPPGPLRAILEPALDHKLESVRSRAARILDQLAAREALAPAQGDQSTIQGSSR